MKLKINEDDEVIIYPSKKLMKYWRAGVPIEEVKRKLRKRLKNNEPAYRLAVCIAVEFYRKWDEDGFIKVEINKGE